MIPYLYASTKYECSARDTVRNLNSKNAINAWIPFGQFEKIVFKLEICRMPDANWIKIIFENWKIVDICLNLYFTFPEESFKYFH